MSSETTSSLPQSVEKRKDDSHTQVLTVPPGGGNLDSMKFQPAVSTTVQKTAIVARPIAPAPVVSQMTTNTLSCAVQKPQSLTNVQSVNTILATAAPSTLLAPASTVVSQSSLLQLASTVSATPINPIIRTATNIQPAGTHLQFPSHLPKGAAAAVSALSGPKSGQTVATAILRPGAQGATIQIPVSSTPGVLPPQSYHQHIQPRGGSIQGSLVGTIRPGTPPVPRTGSPVISAQLQQHIEHPTSRVTLAGPLTVPSSLQITLQPQRSATEQAMKLQQRAAEQTNKTLPRMLVDSTVKLQQSKPDSLTNIQSAVKGSLQRVVADPKGQGHIQRSEPAGKIQLQRLPVDPSIKLSQQRATIDVSGKVLPATDMVNKIALQNVPRTIVDTMNKPLTIHSKVPVQRTAVDSLGKPQTQKASLDLSNKMVIDGKVQITRATPENMAGLPPHVLRTTADDKLHIQRIPRESAAKMVPLRSGNNEMSCGKLITSSLPMSKGGLHMTHSYTTTSLPSKVVFSQVPNYSTSSAQLHQQVTKPGMLPLSAVSSISSQLNAPLSVPSLSSMTTSSGASSSLHTNSIPIAKVTPQRQNPTSLPSSASTPGTLTMATGTVTVQDLSRPDLHLSNQSTTNNLLIPAVNRSTNMASISTPLSVQPPHSHTDARTDRSGVPHIAPFIGSEYYRYGLQSGYSQMVYPNMQSTQPLVQPSIRPRPMTTPTPNLAASLQASIQSQPGTVSRFPPTIVQMDSASRQIHYNSNQLDGSVTPEKCITVTSGQTGYTLSPAGPTITSSQLSQNTPGHSSQQSASPRPSILRKRASDGTPVKKPYCALNDNQSPRPEPQSNNSSPKTPVTESRENSQSSTDTALSNEAAPFTSDLKVKQEPLDNTDNASMATVLNNVEASPRKKPRKQLLNAVEEPREASSSEEEVERLRESKASRETVKPEIREDYIDEDGVRWTVERTKHNMQLMNFYNRPWKSRNNHFLRYQDVKPKEERRPTVNELSNSRSVVQKASGWKLYYMAGQLEDLSDLEKEMCLCITDIQSSVSPNLTHISSKDDQAATRIHELTQGTIQRCQLVKDQLSECKNSMLNILNHQKRIIEIINKHMSKRPIKKKERS